LAEPLERTIALLSRESEASLGTLDGKSPFVSGTIYYFEAGTGDDLGKIYLLLSDLARHTRNLEKEKRVSLLVSETKPGISLLEGERVTVLGEAERVVDDHEVNRLREKFRGRFSLAEILLSLPDFRFYRIRPLEIHWIGGFGRAQSFKLAP
jgi:hypothetical protein